MKGYDDSYYTQEEVVYCDKIPARIIYQKLHGRDCCVSLHWHKELELNLLIEGEADFTVNGKKQKLKAGDMNLINSGVIHMGDGCAELSISDDRKYVELITILWDLNSLKMYEDDDKMLEFHLSCSESVKQQIHDMVLEVGRIFRRNEKYYEMKVTALLLYIGSLLMEHCMIEQTDHQYQKSLLLNSIAQIQEAADFIEKNCSEKLTLQDVSDYVNLAPTYFSKKFRQVSGITFHDYLCRCRLKNAVRDLQATSMNTTEIAFKNGFPNVKSFISAFKEQYQMTPQQYKKYMDKK